MSLMSIRSLRYLSQPRLSLMRRSYHGSFKSLIERLDIRHGLRTTKGETKVPEVMHRHAGAHDDDVLVAQGGDGLAETVVQVYVLAVILAYLDYGDV